MKRIFLIFMLALVMQALFGETPEEYITSAKAIEEIDIFKAIEIMEKAAKKYPQNADVLSFYGLMVSKGAGQANLLKAGGMVYKAEKIFSKALELEPNHKDATLSRGILRVNVPMFFNKLSKGIEDLENVHSRSGLSNDDYLLTSYYLGLGYEKQGNSQKAIEYYNNIIQYGLDFPLYPDSLERLKNLSDENVD